jgi:shikimate kinase
MHKKLVLKKPVVLIGMMGVGKTHVGRLLAKDFNVPFYDSDKVIEEKAGMAVSEIFELFGEKKFRESEKRTVLDLLNAGACVISTGGGAITNSVTLEVIKRKAMCIWLRADLETLWQRVKTNESRPLLQEDNPKQILADLLAKRETLYAQAHITVDVQSDSAHKTIAAIKHKLAAMSG